MRTRPTGDTPVMLFDVTPEAFLQLSGLGTQAGYCAIRDDAARLEAAFVRAGVTDRAARARLVTALDARGCTPAGAMTPEAFLRASGLNTIERYCALRSTDQPALIALFRRVGITTQAAVNRLAGELDARCTTATAPPPPRAAAFFPDEFVHTTGMTCARWVGLTLGAKKDAVGAYVQPSVDINRAVAAMDAACPAPLPPQGPAPPVEFSPTAFLASIGRTCEWWTTLDDRAKRNALDGRVPSAAYVDAALAAMDRACPPPRPRDEAPRETRRDEGSRGETPVNVVVVERPAPTRDRKGWLLGALAGGVAGFFAAGPVGAVVGLVGGAVAGNAIDPETP